MSAEVHARAALSLHQQCGSIRGQATSLRQLGIIGNQRRQFLDAHTFFSESLKLWQQTDDLHGVASCYHGIATGLRAQSAFPLALDRLEAAMDHFNRAGEVLSRVFVIRDIGIVLLAQGHVARGERKILDALSEFSEMAIFIGMASCRRELGRSAKRKDEMLLAVQHFDAASELYSKAESDTESDEMRREAHDCRIRIHAKRELRGRGASVSLPGSRDGRSPVTSAPGSGYASEA